MQDPDPQALAEATRQAMRANDTVLRTLGISVPEVGPGTATATMAVRADMLNGFAICHGGLVATLADTAFAYACNSYNQLTVASGFDVQLLAPSRLGDVLTATASAQHRAGRSGVYDVQVSNQHGECVALFRGRSHTRKGQPVVGGQAF